MKRETMVCCIDKQFKEIREDVLKEINERASNVPYWFICMWLKNNVKNKKWNFSSYGLKHEIERDYMPTDGTLSKYCTHGYCANNWVKVCLVDMGYDVIPSDGSEMTYDSLTKNSVNLGYKLPRGYYGIDTRVKTICNEIKQDN